jgi:hypothetical protein
MTDPLIGQKLRELPVGGWGCGKKGLLLTVRAVVDGRLVVRYWSKRWKCWRYRIVERFETEGVHPLVRADSKLSKRRWLQEQEKTDES